MNKYLAIYTYTRGGEWFETFEAENKIEADRHAWHVSRFTPEFATGCFDLYRINYSPMSGNHVLIRVDLPYSRKGA